MSDAKKQSALIERWSTGNAKGRPTGDEGQGNFNLRDTLDATVVRELSFAEFRAALQNPSRSIT